jgi:hypothetical protein
MTDEEAAKVLKAAREHADCFTREHSPGASYSVDQIATACSNTGYIILSALGYSYEDIKRLGRQ